jgi:hypothetical protein
MDLSPFNIGDVMKSLLNANYSALQPDNLRGEQVTGLFNGIDKNVAAVLAAIPPDFERRLELRRELEAPLPRNQGSKPGKYERVTKMVNIWMEMKDCGAILDLVNTRATRLTPALVSLREYIQTMQRFQERAEQRIEENAQKVLAANYERMPDGEFERKWKDPGVELDAGQFPCCPNPKCRHPFIDGPPSNTDADDLNREAVAAYVAKCREFTAWKAKRGPQPVDDKGELMTKMPKNPETVKKYIRCHCHQFKADPRLGNQCPVGCKYEGQTYQVGACPICMCRCRLFIFKNNYLSMIIANSQPPAPSNANAREDATNYLNANLNTNRLQQQESARFFAQQKENGKLAADSNVSNQIRNHGYMAQALSIAGNPINPSTGRFLKAQIDAIQHPGGRTMTAVGDMRTYGRRLPGDDRARNNNLDGFVSELTEEEQMQIAMMESQEDCNSGKSEGLTEEEQMQIAMNESKEIQLYQPPPRAASAPPPAASASASAGVVASPEFISRTREAAFDKRAQTDKSNKRLRRNLSKVGQALSKPYNEAVVNLLTHYKNDPTPDRLDESLEFMEELDDA